MHADGPPGAPPPNRSPSPPSVARDPLGGTGSGWGRTHRWTIVTVLAVTACIGLVGAALIRIPYYALEPGSIRPTERLIDLGAGVRDPDAGEVSFATVSVDGRLNLLQALSGWWDGTIDVVPEERILQGQTPQQSQQTNQVLMNDSKDVAVHVALRSLGLATSAGAQVAAVVPGSPAEGVLQVGDVVISIDGTPVTHAVELADRVRRARPGEVMTFRVAPAAALDGAPDAGQPPFEVLDAAARTATVTLGRDAAHDTAMLGVDVRDAFRSTYAGAIEIDSMQVGGPSAGLAYTLGIIDLLTPGDLTGGRHVTATGVMDASGTVGAIGGLPQKAVAARRAGVELFLVPAGQSPGELAEARHLAEGVELVPVATLQQALDALASHGGDEVALPADPH